jgi:hypothetical protein
VVRKKERVAGGERAHDSGFDVAIKGIEADDDHRASLGNLVAPLVGLSAAR